MLKAEELLLELVKKNKLSFTEKDLKGVRSAQKRKLLYILGAYKGIMIDKNILDLYGIRKAKKFLVAGIDITDIKKVICAIHQKEIENYHRVLNIDLLDLMNEDSIYYYSMVKGLKNWSEYKNGKDLFIKGLGSFDINLAYEQYKNIYRYSRVILPSELISTGYSGYEPNHYAERALKQNKDLFKWIIVHKFNSNRIDELIDLDILGMWHKDLKVINIERRLEDLKLRGLRLNYKDKRTFEYPEHILDFANEMKFTIPKNGIDLKKQARIFSNCSGNYVNKILSKRAYIIYSGYEMIELTPKGKIIQHLGKRNLELPMEHRRNIMNLAMKFMLK